MRLVNLPVGRLKVDKAQPRKRFGHVDIEQLANTMLSEGVLQPISVVKTEAAFYTIESGERRYRAAVVAGLNVIPCIVQDQVKPCRTQSRQLIENIQREPLHPVDLAQALQKMAAESGAAKTSQMLGKSKSWVSKRIAIAGMSADNLKLADAVNVLDSELLYLLARLDRVAPNACNTMLLNLKQDTGAFSRSAVRKAIRRAKGGRLVGEVTDLEVKQWAGNQAHAIKTAPFGRGQKGVRIEITFKTLDQAKVFMRDRKPTKS